MLSLIITTVLAFTVSLLCIFGVNNYVLACLHAKRKRHPPHREREELKQWPFVTIQVVTHNDGYIVTRLLDNCLKIDYPLDKFEIIIVDDSTDETVDILREYEKQYYPKIKVIHKDEGISHRADALNEALKISRGEFILVLNADSVLEPDFLKKTIPLFFTDEKLGLVQGKLRYLSEGESWITKIFAFISDWFSNFLQELFSRHGMMLGFVGRGGIFRRKAIEDVGGWMSDTVAEDLDMAYRLQLKGWRALYIEDAISFEDAPQNYYLAMIGFKKHLKGSLQNLVKHWRSIIKHKTLNLSGKIEALMQLAYSLVYPLGLICLILTLLAYTIVPGAVIDGFWHSITGFMCSAIILTLIPCVALMISPIPSLTIILLALAFILILFPRFKELTKRVRWVNHKIIFGLLLVWYDSIISCLLPIAEIILGKKGEQTSIKESLKRVSMDKSGRRREAMLRIFAFIFISLLLINIMVRNFSLNSLGIIIPGGFWLYSAYLILRD